MNRTHRFLYEGTNTVQRTRYLLHSVMWTRLVSRSQTRSSTSDVNKTTTLKSEQHTTDSASSVSLCTYDNIIWTQRFHPHGQACPKAALSVDGQGSLLSTGTDELSVCPEWSLATYHIISSRGSVPRGHHSNSCDRVHGHL